MSKKNDVARRPRGKTMSIWWIGCPKSFALASIEIPPPGLENGSESRSRWTFLPSSLRAAQLFPRYFCKEECRRDERDGSKNERSALVQLPLGAPRRRAIVEYAVRAGIARQRRPKVVAPIRILGLVDHLGVESVLREIPVAESGKKVVADDGLRRRPDRKSVV